MVTIFTYFKDIVYFIPKDFKESKLNYVESDNTVMKYKTITAGITHGTFQGPSATEMWAENVVVVLCTWAYILLKSG